MIGDIKLALQALEEGNIDQAEEILSDCVAKDLEETKNQVSLGDCMAQSTPYDPEYRRSAALGFARDSGTFATVADYISAAAEIEQYLRGDSHANA